MSWKAGGTQGRGRWEEAAEGLSDGDCSHESRTPGGVREKWPGFPLACGFQMSAGALVSYTQLGAG